MLKINLDIWSSSIIFNKLVPSKIFPNESGQLSIASTSIRQIFFASTKLWYFAKSMSIKYVEALMPKRALIENSHIDVLIKK